MSQRDPMPADDLLSAFNTKEKRTALAMAIYVRLPPEKQAEMLCKASKMISAKNRRAPRI